MRYRRPVTDQAQTIVQLVRILVHENRRSRKKDRCDKSWDGDVPVLGWERGSRTRRLGPRPGVSWGSVHNS